MTSNWTPLIAQLFILFITNFKILFLSNKNKLLNTRINLENGSELKSFTNEFNLFEYFFKNYNFLTKKDKKH